MENSDHSIVNSSDLVEPIILPITLYAFGNRTSPRSPRPGIDIAVDNNLVKPTQPPTGASTFAEFVEKFLDCGWIYVGKKEIG